MRLFRHQRLRIGDLGMALVCGSVGALHSVPELAVMTACLGALLILAAS
jgi:uncharacterized membrane protein YdcZ (DUF606 family)